MSTWRARRRRASKEARAFPVAWLIGERSPSGPGGHAPDRVGKVVGDDEGAARIHGHSDRPAAGQSVLTAKAGDEIDRRTGGAPVPERHEDHLVADRHFPVPASMLAD